ncbi:MAG: hypothetical protein JXB29_08525 [Sedimentisphaerales bacterium]|nr:hypothetical protein [Sedimentisphaerales bacterium]
MQFKKLTCQQAREYIDGLSQRQFQEKIKSGPVYGHIQQCVPCQEYFEQAKSLAKKLDQWSVPTLKRNIAAGVMAEVAQLEHDGKIEHVSLWSRLPALFVHRLNVPVGVAAAVFVMLAVSLTLNITRLNMYQGSKEKIQAKTEQAALEGTKFAYRNKQKSYPVSIYPASETGACFLGAIPDGAPTALVVILGVPGVIPIETAAQPVSVNLGNQRL